MEEDGNTNGVFLLNSNSMGECRACCISDFQYLVYM